MCGWFASLNSFTSRSAVTGTPSRGLVMRIFLMATTRPVWRGEGGEAGSGRAEAATLDRPPPSPLPSHTSMCTARYTTPKVPWPRVSPFS